MNTLTDTELYLLAEFLYEHIDELDDDLEIVLNKLVRNLFEAAERRGIAGVEALRYAFERKGIH